jgi:hypothetical protein
MKGQPVAAIIHGSSYKEDLTEVILNVIELKEYFTELHIVYPVKYEVSDELKKKLHPIHYHQHYDEITPSLVSNQTLLLVHFHANHQVDETALIALLESAYDNRKNCHHYGVRGKTDLKDFSGFGSFFLGFVWLVVFMDYWRTLLNAWGYYTNEDLIATRVTPHFSAHPTIETYRHAWLFSLFSRIASVRHNTSLLVTPSPKDMFYAFRAIYNHPHMSAWNVQWVLAYVVYYFCFALPWWNFFLSQPIFAGISLKSSLYFGLYWATHRDIYHPVWISLWCVQIIAYMAVVSSRYKNANLSWVFLMPIYVTLSPIMFLIAKNKIIKQK